MILAKRTITPRIRNIIGFNLMLMALFALVITYHSSESYRYTLSASKKNAESTLNSLADHTELSFLVADMTIRRAIERQYVANAFSDLSELTTSQMFKNWLDETPQVVAMALINSQGKITAITNKSDYEDWQNYSETIGGKELLDAMRNGTDNSMFIGIHKLSDKNKTIVMSRRFDHPKNGFAGFVVVAMNPKYFQSFYKSVALGENTYMRITLGDELLASSNRLPEGIEKLQAENALNEFEKLAKTGEINVGVSNIGEKLVVIANKKIKNIPINVSILFGEKEMFERWRSTRDKDIGFLVLFTVFGTVLSFFAVAMSRQIYRAEQSESSAILASQTKSEFLANMSHELRTPLNAIIGYSEMLNSEYFGPINHKQKERVHDINLCGTHLLQLINDILEFSKGNAGKLELIEEKVDIAEVVNEAVRITNGRARLKNIRIITTLDENLKPVWGDRRKIAQMLLNLITNSVKFTPENGTIRVSAKLDSHNALNIVVSDTGIGISEENIPKALSVFGQVQRSQSNEGTGLGLPLCKMYAELHGGKLVLTSKLGSGTTVRIAFPHQRTLTNKG